MPDQSSMVKYLYEITKPTLKNPSSNLSRNSYCYQSPVSCLFSNPKKSGLATETRLKGEAQPVDEICFTPGTRFAAKLSFSIFFK
jgi:hypothetical protein